MMNAHPALHRKPRIALMGEFSAGKSTLANLLLGGRMLPEQVTATRLPPIWMSRAPGKDHRVLTDGSTQEIGRGNISDIPFESTQIVRMHVDAAILNHCDLIDFPGISDPNMDAQVWERVLSEADAIIWLTHATQAWRQSELAIWDTVPETVRAHSILLVTRFDKLTSERDRTRVLARLEHETRGLFDQIFPISLVDAAQGVHDRATWRSSGAEAFTAHLGGLINRLAAGPEGKDGGQPAHPAAEPCSAKMSSASVIPRRIKPQTSQRSARPGGLGLG